MGRLGGFVPWLRDGGGYEAVGVDPVAPRGESYQQIEFERSELAGPVDGVIACASLHHVTQPGEVMDKIAHVLAPGGRVIVVEWDWENFDEATARWCFERLERSGEESWLHRRRDEWTTSRRTWEDYVRAWAHEHGLPGARRLLGDLVRRFQRVSWTRSPYFFPELVRTNEVDELEAINDGRTSGFRCGRSCASGPCLPFPRLRRIGGAGRPYRRDLLWPARGTSAPRERSRQPAARRS